MSGLLDFGSRSCLRQISVELVATDDICICYNDWVCGGFFFLSKLRVGLNYKLPKITIPVKHRFFYRKKIVRDFVFHKKEVRKRPHLHIE